MSIYDIKTGEEIILPYAVDAKEWIATGNYTDVKPEVKAKRTPKAK